LLCQLSYWGSFCLLVFKYNDCFEKSLIYGLLWNHTQMSIRLLLFGGQIVDFQAKKPLEKPFLRVFHYPLGPQLDRL